jgi:hypothetical protein
MPTQDGKKLTPPYYVIQNINYKAPYTSYFQHLILGGLAICLTSKLEDALQFEFLSEARRYCRLYLKDPKYKPLKIIE